MTEILIEGRSVGRESPPFVVAEMSGNHNRSLTRALEIVEAAAMSGAHALKIQTYTADTMTLNLREGPFIVNDPASLWAGRALYDLYEQAHTPWEWHEELFNRARSLGMVPFSTPFDESSVDFLESLGVPCYKISSFENSDLPLIRRVAATGKPLIVSIGMATIDELRESVACAREAGCKELVLLKCTSAYPANPADANLATIPHLRESFDCEVGLSDHTPGISIAVASVALGASVIEKHLTLDRADGGVDAAFSLEPQEMTRLVEESARVWSALGRPQYGPSSAEVPSLAFRRSLYAVTDIAVGEVFSLQNVRAIRPGFGLPPKYLGEVLGKPALVGLARGTALSWEHVRQGG